MSNKFSKQLRANEKRANPTVNLSSSDAQPDVLDSVDFSREKVVELDCSQIERDPSQPRKIFDPIKLQEFYQDILINGQLQPIVVRQDKNGKLIIKLGERRWRAVSLSEGKLKIKAIIVKDDDDMFKLRLAQIAENESRENLDPFELAASYAHLVKLGDEKKLTKQKIAEMLHISRTKLIKFLSIHESSHLKSFIEEKNTKKINDVEALYSLAIVEKDNPEIFNNEEFVDELNNKNIPIREVINKYKNKISSDVTVNEEGIKQKKITSIKNIAIEVLDDNFFILKINNKEFSLSKDQLDNIKNFLIGTA